MVGERQGEGGDELGPGRGGISGGGLLHILTPFPVLETLPGSSQTYANNFAGADPSFPLGRLGLNMV